ncbi:hypothetical protein [Streptomyces sp. SAS_260]|uniref:hypothetical protein n=1 Tax=Streptomyces sp. SAS_260 TaxID=3412751 RepID=UPI00403CC0CB
MEHWDCDEVRRRIRELGSRDPMRSHFWAEAHGYELRPALPEARIRAFEETHGVGLPGEYRSFLAEVGDGPAGPGYGLLP